MAQYYCPVCRKVTETGLGFGKIPQGGNIFCAQDQTRMMRIKPILPLDEWTDEMHAQAKLIFKAMTKGHDVGYAFTSSGVLSGLNFLPQNKDVPAHLDGMLWYSAKTGWEYSMNIEPYLDKVRVR